MSAIELAWGKFKCWQRVCSRQQRLTRPQLNAAWEVWDGMRKTEAAASDGEEDWAEKLSASTIALCSGMAPDLRKGPAIFSHWIAENRAKLRETVVRSVAEASHTSDTVSAQLIR